jgi:hypothetical protein
MIYFMPISNLTLSNLTFLYDETHPRGFGRTCWIRSPESPLDFMKSKLNTRGSRDIFVFVSAYNKNSTLSDEYPQTPILLKHLEDNDLTKHIAFTRKGLTNGNYAPGNIDLFILTRKTRTSASRITLEHINA